MTKELQNSESAPERRIRRVLARARRETGVRDLLTFAIANVWAVLLALGAAVFALVERSMSTTVAIQSGGETTDESH